MGILIDLDQTLIDSQVAESFRKSRNWRMVYQLIPKLRPYAGISHLLQELNSLNVPICIVTSSPQTYCQQVVTHNGWHVQSMVCYHDTKRRKPYPDPILLGLQKLQQSACDVDVVSIGDAAKDTEAARSAHVYSIGSLWGSLEPDQLIKSKPDILCATVNDLRGVLMKYFY